MKEGGLNLRVDHTAVAIASGVFRPRILYDVVGCVMVQVLQEKLPEDRILSIRQEVCIHDTLKKLHEKVVTGHVRERISMACCIGASGTSGLPKNTRRSSREGDQCAATHDVCCRPWQFSGLS